MACRRSNHHHRHTHQPCSCCCCCCSASCCTSDPHPSLLKTTATTVTDPLLQAIAAHLLQSPPAALQPTHHHQHPPTLYDAHPHQRHKNQRQPPPPQDQGLVQSLLRRIAALESTLPHLSPPLPPSATAPPPRNPQPSPPVPPATRRVSIRDVAARTIQAHFRLYLVRRSQTLRHLKHLAAVRSHVAAVKSSLSDETRMSPKALSRKATDLLLQLDSIQSTDPMIREAKRSVSRELVQLLEFADEVSAERPCKVCTESLDRVASTDESSPRLEELAGVSPVLFCEDDEESDAGSPKTRASTSNTVKRVSFAENGNDFRVSTPHGAPFAEEEVTGGWASGEHRRRPVTDPSRRDGGAVEAHWEGGGGGSLQTSNVEKSPGGRRKAGIPPVTSGPPPGRSGDSHLLGLSAPLPVQMEPRRGDSRKKNAM